METADALDDSDDEVDYSKMDQVHFILIQIICTENLQHSLDCLNLQTIAR